MFIVGRTPSPLTHSLTYMLKACLSILFTLARMIGCRAACMHCFAQAISGTNHAEIELNLILICHKDQEAYAWIRGNHVSPYTLYIWIRG